MSTDSATLDEAATGVEADASAGEAPAPYVRLTGDKLVEQWTRFETRFTSLLLAPEPEVFVQALEAFDAELLPLIEHDVDRGLLVAMYSTSTTNERYCAAHSMQVALGCHLAARVLGDWDAAKLQQLRLAALTMNIGMAALQDELACQDGPMTPEQRAVVDQHQDSGAERLQALGVTNADWVAAVRHHHDVEAGAPEGRPQAEQMARLIQRVDRLTAAQSLRSYQDILGAAAAARVIFTDEQNQPDAYGAAVIKALGIYPPGSLVRLANEEIAIVLRRGERANQPQVASVVRDTALRRTMTPQLRDTRSAEFAVKRAVTYGELKMRLDLPALLQMAA